MIALLFFIVFFTLALLVFSRKDGKEENLTGNG
jgi:hypothetical protein